MTFNTAVRTCLQLKYASFAGRAARSEYWWFALASLLYVLAVTVVFLLINALTGGFSTQNEMSTLGIVVLCAGLMGYLALILPGISVTVRRFHDLGLSGWWVLSGYVLGAMPVLGWIATIAMFVATLIKGTTGDNKFGPDPLI